MSSLRGKQIESLQQMLNLHQPVGKNSISEPVWKVLVYDRYGQDIISPLLSVKELREMGVTLHVQLHSDRDPIPDVPAVYFCLPSEDNLNRIGQDFQSGLYDAYYLNFISPISRQRLEDLASSALQANSVTQIQKVYDQYLNFISLEDDLFILRNHNAEEMSYYAINRGEVKDTEMESIMDTIVDSLFSVFATMGTVPVIRSQSGNAAAMVAEKLDKKLRENLRDTRNSLFTTDAASGQFAFQRPLLILLDRNVDMATPLHHPWTYQALTHDIFDLRLNRVVVEEDAGKSAAGGARSRTKTCELDSSDRFWVSHKGSPFPSVAEAIQKELEQYRASEDEVKKLKASMGLENESDATVSLLSDHTAKLTSAVSSLPQMLEMKRLIDMHTTVATAILNHIKARKLDTFFEVEEKVTGKASLDRSLMEMLNDPDLGIPEDKLRLFLIYYISVLSMSEVELDQYTAALINSGCDLSALSYIKRWKTYSSIQPASNNQYIGGGGSMKTIGMFNKLMSQGSSFVMEGVKNFVVKKHNLPVTRIVDDLMEIKGSQETEDFRYFDPKLLRVPDGQVPKGRSPYQDAIVFIVGGGCYTEYQNLVDYCKNKNSSNPKRIVYGCTAVNNASQFLHQLERLGKEIK